MPFTDRSPALLADQSLAIVDPRPAKAEIALTKGRQFPAEL